MKPLFVIADDLTGAAEIAGIGLRFGLSTQLVVQPTAIGQATADLTVVNADTRSLPESEARRIVSAVAQQISPASIIFKKIDSVLRGHVMAEVESTLLVLPRYDRALLIPQNPSRQRVILRDGTYLVEGVPLAKTAFAIDPDHPTRTSNAVDRVGGGKRLIQLIADASQSAPQIISIASAENVSEVDALIRNRPETALLVGAADAFTALLHGEGHTTARQRPIDEMVGRKLFVCGSTASTSRRALRGFAAAQGVEVVDATRGRACDSIRAKQLAVVMSPEPGGIEVEPREIEELLAISTREVIDECGCEWVFAEGGATAMAICRCMNWVSLDVEGELAPGVVVLRPDRSSLRLVIKPGSYAWPACVLKR